MPTDSHRQSAMTRSEWINLLAAHVDLVFSDEINRKQTRYKPDFGTATITFEDEHQATTITGRLLDISADGLMAKLHRRIDVYTAVWVDLVIGDDHASVIGYVKHATPTVGGYKLGVALQFSD